MPLALITGSASGFGLALSKRLAPTHDLFLLDYSPQSPFPSPNKVHCYQCDVSKRNELCAAFKKCVDMFGSIDVVVNNAGIVGTPIQFEEDLNDEWIKTMDVNLIAVIMGTRLALTQMKKQPTGGVIVNIASLAGLYPQPNTPIYSTSKSGVAMLTRSLSPALPSKIRINAVCPSFAPTKLFESALAVVGGDAGKFDVVSIDKVVDAMMLTIEDPRVRGECVRVTGSLGIDFYKWGGRKGESRL